MVQRRFLIDTDTASDDAVALVMALRHPGVHVEAITVVAGNVGVNQGVQNALYTVEQCGAFTPVYRGAAAPLRRPLGTASHVHGLDGMGDIGLELTGRTAAAGDAVDRIIEIVHAYQGEITLVSLGPLTNLAHALKKDSGIATMVKEYVMMGGVGQGPGNITPVAEYNIWVDPDAAGIVFASGLPIKMVGWDISRKYALMRPDTVAAIRGEGTELAAFCMDIQATVEAYVSNSRESAWYTLPDPIAMSVALDPAVATRTGLHHVAVEVESDLCRGQTVVDHTGVTGQNPNAEIVFEASAERFVEMLKKAVRG